MLWWWWKQQNRSTIPENSRDTFSLFPQLQLSSFNNFLQRARDGSEKIKTSTRRHPPSLFSKRSEIFPSGRFSTTVRRQPLLGIETPEKFIYSKWLGEWMQTKMPSTTACGFIDIQNVIREKQSHPFLYHHPSRLSSGLKAALENEWIESRVGN